MMTHMQSDSSFGAANNSASQKKLLNNAKSVAKKKLMGTHSTADGPLLMGTITDNRGDGIINLQLGN